LAGSLLLVTLPELLIQNTLMGSVLVNHHELAVLFAEQIQVSKLADQP
jgi:hypothetical protein